MANIDRKTAHLSGSSSLNAKQATHLDKIVMYKKKINRVKRLASDYKDVPRSFKTIKEKPDDEYFAETLIFRSVINEL